MAKNKMWNGIGWYGFIGVITTSTTDISLGFFEKLKINVGKPLTPSQKFLRYNLV